MTRGPAPMREEDLGRRRGQRDDPLRLGRDLDDRALVIGHGGEDGRGGAGGRRGAGRGDGGAGTARWWRDGWRRPCAGAGGDGQGCKDKDGGSDADAPSAGWGGQLGTSGRDRTGGVATGIANPSLRLGRRRGVRGRRARSCLPFSRRFEHAPWGRRPDFCPCLRGSHRSGTVPDSHRLRDHAAFDGCRARA